MLQTDVTTFTKYLTSSEGKLLAVVEFDTGYVLYGEKLIYAGSTAPRVVYRAEHEDKWME